ncbi:MAG: hypothetical protein EOP20_03790, partial [Hyphomicrobiales bacterium]
MPSSHELAGAQASPSQRTNTMTPTATTISVFGAGYVGCVSAACLVQDGHQVIAVDPDTHKIESLAKGLAPIYEPGLDELIAIGHETGALSATSDYV